MPGDELCNDYLLPSIPDTHITSSSSLVPRGGNAYTGPERGRLNTTQTTLGNGTILMGGWAPAADNKGQYIQVIEVTREMRFHALVGPVL